MAPLGRDRRASGRPTWHASVGRGGAAQADTSCFACTLSPTSMQCVPSSCAEIAPANGAAANRRSWCSLHHLQVKRAKRQRRKRRSNAYLFHHAFDRRPSAANLGAMWFALPAPEKEGRARSVDGHRRHLRLKLAMCLKRDSRHIGRPRSRRAGCLLGSAHAPA